jgi:GntR family transcriptional regulator
MADPLWRQIAEDLRRRIESGEVTPGRQIEAEIELRQRYNASRNTVRDALRWLTARGLVESRVGQGTFVVERREPVITVLSGPGSASYGNATVDLRGEDPVSRPTVTVQRGPENIAAMLGLPSDTEFISRKQVRFIEGVAWAVETSFYPRELVTRGAELLLGSDDIHEGALVYLEKTLGLKEAGCQDRILVGPPDRDETALFKLSDDGRVSVITILRTSYSSSDEGPAPFRVTIIGFPADRNHLLINFGMVPEG